MDSSVSEFTRLTPVDFWKLRRNALIEKCIFLILISLLYVGPIVYFAYIIHAARVLNGTIPCHVGENNCNNIWTPSVELIIGTSLHYIAAVRIIFLIFRSPESIEEPTDKKFMHVSIIPTELSTIDIAMFIITFLSTVAFFIISIFYLFQEVIGKEFYIANYLDLWITFHAFCWYFFVISPLAFLLHLGICIYCHTSRS